MSRLASLPSSSSSSSSSSSRSSLSRSIGRALSCALIFAMSAAPATAFAKRMPPNDRYEPVTNGAPSIAPIDRDEPAMPMRVPEQPMHHAFALPPPSLPSQADMPPPDVRMPQRALDRQSVRAALVDARARNLAAFRAYQKRGVFPSNTFKGKKANVWLDADGHFCAAATIIKTSGKVDLVNKVAEQNNFIRLADVKQGPLMDWILTSGFTQDEIAAIQEPFMPVAVKPAIEPSEPVLVDAKLRRAEDARLLAKYRSVDKMLVKQANKSLDVATDRLMKHPQLAWLLIDEE